MNYGYNPTTKDIKLAERIQNEVIAKLLPDEDGMKPYIEVNGLYDGVRIRRITHYSDEARNQIIDDMDKIYNEMFGK